MSGEGEYEGSHCTICGAESGNTDWCVPCAGRVLALERMEQTNDD